MIINGIVKFVIAASYIIIPCLFTFLYIVCMRIIVTDKVLFSIPYYKFSIYMCILEIVQLFTDGFMPAIFLLFNGTITWWSCKVVGGILNSSWFALSAFTHVVAINRFIHMYFPSAKVKGIFSLNNVNLIIGILYIYWFMWLALFLSPFCSINFDIVDMTFNYEKDVWSQRVRQIEICLDLFNAFSILVWYILVFLKLKSKRKQITDQNIASGRSKLETTVLIQASILCLVVVFLIFTWFGLPLITDDEWILFSTNYVWLACSCTNVVLYLIFNKNIRRRFLAFLCRRWNKTYVNTQETELGLSTWKTRNKY